MMRRLVDLALNNRIIVLSIAILLFIWGIISFKKLPVEAYPDVANTWVQVITQWPGRASPNHARSPDSFDSLFRPLIISIEALL